MLHGTPRPRALLIALSCCNTKCADSKSKARVFSPQFSHCLNLLLSSLCLTHFCVSPITFLPCISSRPSSPTYFVFWALKCLDSSFPLYLSRLSSDGLSPPAAPAQPARVPRSLLRGQVLRRGARQRGAGHQRPGTFWETCGFWKQPGKQRYSEILGQIKLNAVYLKHTDTYSLIKK